MTAPARCRTGPHQGHRDAPTPSGMALPCQASTFPIGNWPPHTHGIDVVLAVFFLNVYVVSVDVGVDIDAIDFDVVCDIDVE